jgi:hypothetical protein
VRTLAGVALVAAAGAAAIAGAGALRWQAATRALHDALEAAREPPRPARHDARELDALPEPVRRYFRAVLRDGAPIVAGAEVVHRGTFNASEAGEAWKPFTSTQRVVTRRPGFVWDARIAFAPGVAVHVHDAYVAGEGLLRPSLLGLVDLGTMRDTGEVARGELMRFLAEAAWYPTALLPSQGVRWTAVDERSARATLVDGEVSLTMTFRFDEGGLVESVTADARGRTVGGRIEPTPWEGRWSNWQWRDGMRVPLDGEVAWLLPSGRRPYWRGTIASIAYRFAD